MDPLTHAVIGLGVAAVTGETSLVSPVTIGAVVGAMSPDIDVIAKYWGDYKYLKHHRGITHSIPSVVGLSIAISGVLFGIFSGHSFMSIFIATLLGTLSHTFFDGLNSYGVKPLLPFKDKKYLGSLIMLYDPVITVLSIGLFVSNIDAMYKGVIGIGTIAIYLAYRHSLKSGCYDHIVEEYDLSEEDSLHLMPNLVNFFKWDFVLERDGLRVVGRINALNNRIVEVKRLEREDDNLIREAYLTELGKYFDEFTSSVNHVKVIRRGAETELQFIDLRYHLRDDFMHHATLIYDDRKQLKQSVFRPYRYDRQIAV